MNSSVIISNYYEKRKTESRAITLRTLARKLGISAAMLSQIMKSKKSLPVRLVDPLCDLLDIDHVHRDTLLKNALRIAGYDRVQRAFELSTKLKFGEKALVPIQMGKIVSGKHLKFLSQWTAITILEATSLKGFDGSARYIAKRLNLPILLVEATLKKLVEAGALIGTSGCLKKAERFLQVRTLQNPALTRKFHIGHMQNACRILEEKTSISDIERRFVTGSTLTISKNKVPELKQRLQKLLLDISNECVNDDADEIYQFAIQLIPLSEAE